MKPGGTGDRRKLAKPGKRIFHQRIGKGLNSGGENRDRDFEKTDGALQRGERQGLLEPETEKRKSTTSAHVVLFLFGMSLRGFPRCIAVCLIYKAWECSYKEDVYINWSFIIARSFLGETTGNNITAITTNVVA